MHVGFKVLTAVVLKSSVFCDITSCSQLKVIRRFGVTCRLHLQGRRILEAKTSMKVGLFFYPEEGGDIFLRNVGLL
jgi:hypothetical protein